MWSGTRRVCHPSHTLAGLLTGHAPASRDSKGVLSPARITIQKGRIRSRLGQQHFDFHRKLCIGDVNAVCME
jgi:hypothetical protein